MDPAPEKTADEARAETIDRRQFQRVNFPAMAELTDSSTGLRMSVRVSDLGKGGCYVDVINPAPAGTPVAILIRHANKKFEARGAVSYALPQMGMGIIFTQIAPGHEAVLEEWLGMRPPEPPAEIKAVSQASVSSDKDLGNREVTRQLIALLMRQRVISESQANELLRLMDQG